MTENRPTVEFGELPPDGRGDMGFWSEVAAKLRTQPGDWARVITKQSTGASSYVANQIRHGGYKDFRPGGQFEAVTRGCDVWARFVGESA